MAKDKPKAIKLHSPRGTFRYPRLGEPDYGNERFPKPDGEYSVQLVLQVNDPATKAFIEKLQPYYDRAITSAKAQFEDLKVETRKKLKAVTENPLYSTVYDEETEKPTGEIIFKFAMPAKVTIKKGPKAGKVLTFKPAIFDAAMKPMDGKKIWGGTTGVVAFSIRLDRDTEEPGYFIKGTGAAGLKLSLEAAQVINLVQGGNRSAAEYGFAADEEGYTDDGSKVDAEESAKGGTSAPDQEGSGGSNVSGNDEDF